MIKKVIKNIPGEKIAASRYRAKIILKDGRDITFGTADDGVATYADAFEKISSDFALQEKQIDKASEIDEIVIKLL
ncbi:hypothetical protein [Limosilactobacillus ingluviei]|uniref:hypothetical protein n=1 Tax=Limosilactobacillus ingluviei TaxID=148604 RepID=UPI0002D285F5|nr:hypothetical protein [Limosilactobacillus ingluviei]